MGGTGVIDRFLEVFTRYIDSGFGLLQGEVKWVAGVLIAIDLVLAALFWATAPDEDVIARLVKKTLFIGVFAYIINNWTNLARIVFESFAGLGLKASGTGMSEADFLCPGRVAQVGLDAGKPVLDSISGLMGFVSFFENFIQIAVLLFAWAVVLLAFFIMAIQLFVSLIEFKLTTLAGFVLIPFGLFNKTAFAAERVLGNVMSSGIKVLVLAVIVGIGSTLFSQFTQGFTGQPTIEDAMGLVLAALSLLGSAPLAGCAHYTPPEISYDNTLHEAVLAADPPKPVQIVQVPQPLPLPDQRKPLPNGRARTSRSACPGRARESRGSHAANPLWLHQRRAGLPLLGRSALPALCRAGPSDRHCARAR